VNLPSPGEVLAAIFSSGPQAEPAEITIGPCDQMTGPEGEAGS
jgi:hypothetical protein